MNKRNNTNTNDSLSPLRYPGSKKKLIPYLIRILDKNDLKPSILVEPFAGGASVSLHFLQYNLVSKVIIADKDKLIYSFWHTLFNNPQHLVRFIRGVEISLETYNKYKKIAKRTNGHSKQELAETCIFLNRTSFSGILSNSAGPIGGPKQSSKYKIHCRFNRQRLIENIIYISTFRKKVIVLPYDWKRTIKYAKNWANKAKMIDKIFFYFDPPFYYKAERLYRKFFNAGDHKRLSKKILSLRHDWILSYDNAKEVKKLYSKNRCHIELPYSINSHAKRLEKELIITPLSLPRMK